MRREVAGRCEPKACLENPLGMGQMGPDDDCCGVQNTTSCEEGYTQTVWAARYDACEVQNVFWNLSLVSTCCTPINGTRKVRRSAAA